MADIQTCPVILHSNQLSGIVLLLPDVPILTTVPVDTAIWDYAWVTTCVQEVNGITDNKAGANTETAGLAHE